MTGAPEGADNSDLGWSEPAAGPAGGPAGENDERLLQDRPPHHDGRASW